ncbi:MAG: outer membrane lipoprotein carrier protein LolA [Acidobacteria bacterium]|nr:outer membrane lipoprotein carrier protein LolA [Acidobacteriota bacterium]
MNTPARTHGGRSAALAALAALALFTFEAESSSSSSATLAKIRAAYGTPGSVSCTFVQTYAPAGFAETAPETGKLVLQAPDRVRFDYDGPEGKVFTFDGTAGRQYVAADRQLVVRKLAPGDRERLPIVFLESAEALLARYVAAETPVDSGLVEVVLTPKKPGGPKSISLLALAATGEVKRLVLLDNAGNRTTFTFTQKIPGAKRPDSDFALSPPEGTKILTE